MSVMGPGGTSDERGAVESIGLIESWLLGTAIVGSFEWTLLVAHSHDEFRDGKQIISMLGLEFGNLLPYTLGASLLWLLCDVLGRVLARKVKRPEFVLLGGAFVLALPYTAWLASYTFSGPQARELAYRTPAIVVLTLLLGSSFAAAIWLHLRAARSSRPFLRGAGLSLAALLLLELNVTFLPNEYQPIHSFLGGWAILFSTLAANHFTAASSALRLATRRAKASLATVGSVWCVGSTFILARANDYAWLLWSETGSSRYVTTRVTLLAPAAEANPKELGPIRPNVESDATRAARERRRAARAPNIVIFSIDGLRTDHVGAYGYTKHPTTPNIDRFAQRGVRFARAYSTWPSTQYFNSALLLGRFVPTFSAHKPPPAYQEQAITRLLDQRGYHILVKSWFEHSSQHHFDPSDYAIDTDLPKPKSKRRMEEPMEDRLEAIATHLDQARAKDEPAFVWLHLLGTHVVAHDFVPHPDYHFGEERMDMYDSAIAGSDVWLHHLERLMAERASGDRPTIWVLCSDHGVKENSEGRGLSQPIVHVPLIVVAPGVEPRVENAPVDVSLDLAATVVDWAGIEPPASYDGVSILPALSSDEAALNTMNRRVIPLAYRNDSIGALYDRFKYLKVKGAESLFDIEADPEEKRNIIGEHAELAQSLGSVAEAEIARRTASYRNRRKGEPAVKDENDDDN